MNTSQLDDYAGSISQTASGAVAAAYRLPFPALLVAHSI